MYSVVPHLLRKSTTNYKIPNSNFFIEKGTTVMIPIDAIHYDPDLYPNPEKFDPERFSTGAHTERHFAAYLPFGAGPRHCIGMRFSKMKVFIGLITLLHRFKFSVCENTQIPMKFDPRHFPLSAKGGVYLKVEELSK